jgi:midasin
LSTQSDSADLLGSFKPREAGTLCYPLVATFLQLFAETFPREPNSEFATRVVRA